VSIVTLTGGEDGNLSSRADVADHGANADTVTVLSDAFARSYNIFTFAGADIVDTTKSNLLNLNAAILGTGNDTFHGGNASDTVYDGSGNDVVHLGGGRDMIRVSAGNDVYDGGSGSDYVSFGFQSFDGAGANINNTLGVRCDLSLATRQDFGVFGRDIIKGFENIDGSDGMDRFLGSAANNGLYGMSGDDVLIGRAGNDKLNGGFGNDRLSGGAGSDTLIGESGADSINCGLNDKARDIVKYTNYLDSLPAAGAGDVITNFHSGRAAWADRIDLSLLDANRDTANVDDAFIYRSSGGFVSVGGEVMVVQNGADAIVMIDTDADSDVEIQLTLKNVSGISAIDFLL
jgi:serralysin